MKVADIARICHAANNEYCRILNDGAVPPSPPWDEAPDWQRDSVIAGVRNKIENPDITPQESHESWLALKEAEGWKYGPVKDVATREHPCCVPYEQLDERARAKDELFLAIVNVFRSSITGEVPA